MNDMLKVALILAAAIVVATVIVTYFSPYYSCLRGSESEARSIICARAVGGVSSSR